MPLLISRTGRSEFRRPVNAPTTSRRDDCRRQSVFDDHTECQCYFYDCFDVNDHVYFNSNDPQSTWTYLKQHMSIPTESYLLDPINYTEDPVNAQRKGWKNLILKTIDLNKIKQFYTQHDAKTYAHLADLNDR